MQLEDARRLHHHLVAENIYLRNLSSGDKSEQIKTNVLKIGRLAAAFNPKAAKKALEYIAKLVIL